MGLHLLLPLGSTLRLRTKSREGSEFPWSPWCMDRESNPREPSSPLMCLMTGSTVPVLLLVRLLSLFLKPTVRETPKVLHGI